MLKTLILLVGLVAIVILPVKYAAEKFEASRTSTGAVLFAVIFKACSAYALEEMISRQWISLPLSIVVGSIIFSLILGTTFFRGLAISVVASIIMFISIVLLAGALMAI